jgi:hypothetical protein
MSHGRFPTPTARRDRQSIRDDKFETLTIMRGRRGAEERIAAFQGRIAGTSSSSLGRDHQKDIASTSSRIVVITAPMWLSVRRGDEIWTKDEIRYRIISVDEYPGQIQIIAEMLQ